MGRGQNLIYYEESEDFHEREEPDEDEINPEEFDDAKYEEEVKEEGHVE